MMLVYLNGLNTFFKIMKPNFRNVLEMALEEGVRVGWNRAHKYVEGEPHIDNATDVIVTEIFNSLDPWFDHVNGIEDEETT